VFTQLINEHGELTRLLRGISDAKTRDQRSSLYPVLRTDLLAHEHTERAVLYGTLREFPATQAMADAHEREVGELESSLAQLDALSFETEAWYQALATLLERLQHHIRHEEDEVFPLARETLGERKSHDLKVAYLGTKAGLVNTIEAEAPPGPRSA